MKCEQNYIRWKTDGQTVEIDLTDQTKLQLKPLVFRKEVSMLPESLKGSGIEGTSNLQREACKREHKIEGCDERQHKKQYET